jgi:hypothetical protein
VRFARTARTLAFEVGSGTAHLAVASARDDVRGDSPSTEAPLTAPDHDLPGRLCRIGIWVAFLTVALQSVVYLVDELLFDHEPHLLDADGDFSVWAWGSASVLFVGALASVLLALTAERARILTYTALVAILAFLSLDETVGIHERLTNDLPSLLGVPVSYSRVIWPAVYLPLLATLAVLLLVVSRRLAARPARLVRVGLLLLAVAVAAELVSTALVESAEAGRSLPYVLEVAVEEGCELGGWILIATALVSGMVSQLLALGRTSRPHGPAALHLAHRGVAED